MKLDGLSLLHAWLRPAEMQGLVQGKKQNLGGLGLLSGKKQHKHPKGLTSMSGDVRGNLTGTAVRHLTGRRYLLDSLTGNETNVAAHGAGVSISTGTGISIGGVTAGAGGGGNSVMIPVAQLSDHYNTRVFLWHKDTEDTPVDAR